MFAAAILVGLSLSACQTTGSTPADTVIVNPLPTAEIEAAMNNTWSGYFTNRQGNRYAVSFTFNVANGVLTGTGNIPSSTFNSHPTLTGTVDGHKVTVETNSGFTYDLTLSADGSTLSGDVSGANYGTLKLTR
jgi:hypothetical protein